MSHRINVFLSDDDKKKLEYIANFWKIKKPQALKRMAFSNLKNFETLGDLKPQLENLVFELGKQGNNLNQIAHQLNKGEHPQAERIIKVIEKNREQFTEILLFKNEIVKRLSGK